MKVPMIFNSRAILLLSIGVVSVVTRVTSQFPREDCRYGKSTYNHGQTVDAIPSCCTYLKCHDGDIQQQHVGQPGDIGCCEFAGLIYPNGAELGAQCVTMVCRRGEWIVSQDIVPCCKHCYLLNDPHIRTFDGHYYEWHGACNYSIAQSGTSLNPEVGVFSDFMQCYNTASCLHVTTFKNDFQTLITLQHEDPFTVVINGNEFVVPTTGVSPLGNHPILAWRDDTCVFLLGSSKIMLQHCRHRLDVWAHPVHVNNLHGLCGHFNFHKEDDFTSRSLTVHPLQTWPLAFPESWRTADQGFDCKTCYDCDRESTEDPCPLDDIQRQTLRSICSRRLHWILATDVELDHYVDACVFDLCQLRQGGGSTNEEERWLRVLEILAQIAKIILAKTAGEWVPVPDPPSQGICVPGSRWNIDCNGCQCTDDGMNVICTLIACPADFIHPLEEEACTTGSRWKNDCNWCSCVRGGFVCSRDPCGPETTSGLFTAPSTTASTTTIAPLTLQCLHPLHFGDCFGYFKRYGFNPTTGQCESFIYSGCGGNQNNFGTFEECERACNFNSIFGQVNPY